MKQTNKNSWKTENYLFLDPPENRGYMENQSPQAEERHRWMQKTITYQNRSPGTKNSTEANGVLSNISVTQFISFLLPNISCLDLCSDTNFLTAAECPMIQFHFHTTYPHFCLAGYTFEAFCNSLSLGNSLEQLTELTEDTTRMILLWRNS